MHRSYEEGFFTVLMTGAMAIVVLGIVSVLFTVVINGITAMNLPMITETPHGGFYLGRSGGILNAILGSIFLASGAVIIALAMSIPVVMYLHYPKAPILAHVSRILLDIACGIPTIVYGAIVFMIMVLLGGRSSLFWGMLTVSIFIMPIMIRSMDEILAQVPKKVMIAAFALGTTRTEMLSIVMRQSLPGLLTAILLAFGRGIGDAASVLFTAGYSDSLPESLFEPVATLPLAILFQISSPYPVVQQRAYAAGLILLIIILTVSITSRLLSKKFMKYVVK